MWSIPSPDDPLATRAAGEGPALGTAKAVALRQEGPDAQRLSDSPQYAVERSSPTRRNDLERFAGTNWIESPERGNGRRDKRHLFFCGASRSQGRDTGHKCQGCYTNLPARTKRHIALETLQPEGAESCSMNAPKKLSSYSKRARARMRPWPTERYGQRRQVFMAAGSCDAASMRGASPRRGTRTGWPTWP